MEGGGRGVEGEGRKRGVEGEGRKRGVGGGGGGGGGGRGGGLGVIKHGRLHMYGQPHASLMTTLLFSIVIIITHKHCLQLKEL